MHYKGVNLISSTKKWRTIYYGDDMNKAIKLLEEFKKENE